MIAYITQALNNFATKISNLELSFEAGDIVMPEAEAHGSIEVEAPQPPPEMICGILSQIKDPSEIANLMEINRTWYREGSRLLNKDRDEFIKWLRINRIEQLDQFLRYLKLDRLDTYNIKIKNLKIEHEEALRHFKNVHKDYEIALKNERDYISKMIDEVEEVSPHQYDDEYDIYQYGLDEVLDVISEDYPEEDEFDIIMFIELNHNSSGKVIRRSKVMKRLDNPSYEELLKIKEDRQRVNKEAFAKYSELHYQRVEFEDFIRGKISPIHKSFFL